MNSFDEWESKIKTFYKKVAEQPKQEKVMPLGENLAEQLGYPANELDQIPQPVLESFAGIGYYFDIANIMGGESVLVLGSGSGTDTLLAGLKVGKTGKVLGIDMTPEQLSKAEDGKKKAGVTNVSFQQGMIESLGMHTDPFDVVLSNGAINLSSDKGKVFEEIERVLRYGGRMIISLMISKEALPAHIQKDASLWACCIGGAMLEKEYQETINNAGLRIIHVKENPYTFSESVQDMVQNFGVKSISILAEKLH